MNTLRSLLTVKPAPPSTDPAVADDDAAAQALQGQFEAQTAMLTDIIYIGYWWPHLSAGQIFAARWELVGKHKSREHRRRDCVTRATVAEAIDVELCDRLSNR